MLRMMQGCVLAASMLATAALGTATARAQDQETGEVDLDRTSRGSSSRRASRSSSTDHPAPGPLRLYGGLSIAAGGELKLDDADFDEGGSELFPTIGFHAGADFVLMDYFSIGGETRFLFFKPEAIGDDDRSFLWDISVKPRGRYAFDGMPLEVYLALPLGLTVPGIEGEAEGEVGWNIGIVAGANYFFSESLGVSLELGWHFHKFGIESGEGLGGEYDVKMNQFLFLAPSFVYAL